MAQKAEEILAALRQLEHYLHQWAGYGQEGLVDYYTEMYNTVQQCEELLTHDPKFHAQFVSDLAGDISKYLTTFVNQIHDDYCKRLKNKADKLEEYINLMK